MKSHHHHQQQQPTSTCGQCGKMFSRQDNLVKHLRHCTGHRPPPPPQQQQQQHTTTPPPPKFTINHQYKSIGGAVERYNINMQETQHLNHLSTVLHLLLPPMKNFRTKHHAYKLQVTITIACGGSECCHTTTSYPNFRNDCCVYAADAVPPLDDVNRQLLNFIEVFELNTYS